MKQAARCWWIEVDKTFIELGFQKSPQIQGVYFLSMQDEKVFILLYVDDILVASSSLKKITNIIEKINEKYHIKVLGEIRSFLNIRIRRNREKNVVYLDQQMFLEKMLEKFNWSKCNTRATPCSPGQVIGKKSPDKNVAYIENVNPEFKKMFQSKIGALLYLGTTTRPDIAWIVHLLGRYASNPQPHHMDRVHDVFRYLKGSLNLCLKLQPVSAELAIYTDADHAGDPDGRLSTTGTIVLFGGSPILWKSKKQNLIAKSTAYAEYQALAAATEDIRLIKNYIQGFGYQLKTPILYCDNEAAIVIANADHETTRSKHIDIQYHITREALFNKEFQLRKVSSGENIADSLTKSVATQVFYRFRDALFQHLEGECSGYTYNYFVLD